ncbi:unnamed protein product [Blepharisma stoltei]|uniref:FAD/NAD(P)-binding domain-containing protein n=1 Tax=Blepharisma stoltei TaxID=1481888 RepID=A0AAU9IXK3_9CILI|nr:unnamed protein product [Blepharisma stoltei]
MMSKVLIIGGSFAGLTAARELCQDFQVTLVDLKEYYEYTPGILRAMVDPNAYPSISVKYADISQSMGFDFIKGEVIELSSHSAEIQNAQGIVMTTFDYCIIACGTDYYDPIKPHRTYEDLSNERHETIIETHDEIEEAQSIMILGAGIVGVELAGELVSKFHDKNITLYSAQDVIMPGMPKLAQKYAENFLTEKGVKIVYNKKASEEEFKDFDLVFKCIGVIYNTKFLQKNFQENLNDRGKIVVNDFLQVKEHIFAAGDVAQTTLNLAGTAYAAEQMGKLLAKNIRAIASGSRLREMGTLPMLYCVSLGPEFGVTVYQNLVIPGSCQAFVKFFIQYTKVKELENPMFNLMWKGLDFAAEALSHFF